MYSQRAFVLLILLLTPSLYACRSHDLAPVGGDAQSGDAAEVEEPSRSADADAGDSGSATPDFDGPGDDPSSSSGAAVIAPRRDDPPVIGADGSDAAVIGAGGSDAGSRTEFAYVATYLGGLLGYSIEPQTGALVPLPGSPYDGRAGLFAVSLHPSGDFIYVADYLGKAVDAFRIDQSNGELTRLPGFPFPVTAPAQLGAGPVALTLHPSGRFAYVVNNGHIEAYAIAADTGVFTVVPGSPFSVASPPAVLAVEPAGRYLYASRDLDGTVSGYAIDAVSGALTELDGSPFGANLLGRGGAIVFHPNGRFLFKGGGNVSSFRIDPSGVLTDVTGTPVAGGGSDDIAIDVAIDPSGQYLYGVTTSTGLLRGYAIDPDTGVLAAVPGSPFTANPSPYSVAVDPSGRFVYVGNDDASEVSAFSVDRSTGTLSPVAGAPFDAYGLQPEFAIAGTQLPSAPR